MDPLFLTNPVSPFAFLSHMIRSHPAYPTTILICGLTQADFLSILAQDLLLLSSNSPPTHNNININNTAREDLLTSPSLAQLSVTRHIRTLFIPTVSHLRAFLSVFSIHDSKVPPPPFFSQSTPREHQSSPLLVAYNFISSHRDTSEWSIQGISNTVATLVEAAKREGLRAVTVESTVINVEEKIPVLSGSSRRMFGSNAASGTGWIGRTAELNKVLRRWFRFQDSWDTNIIYNE